MLASPTPRWDPARASKLKYCLIAKSLPSLNSRSHIFKCRLDIYTRMFCLYLKVTVPTVGFLISPSPTKPRSVPSAVCSMPELAPQPAVSFHSPSRSHHTAHPPTALLICPPYFSSSAGHPVPLHVPSTWLPCPNVFFVLQPGFFLRCKHDHVTLPSKTLQYHRLRGQVQMPCGGSQRPTGLLGTSSRSLLAWHFILSYIPAL